MALWKHTLSLLLPLSQYNNHFSISTLRRKRGKQQGGGSVSPFGRKGQSPREDGTDILMNASDPLTYTDHNMLNAVQDSGGSPVIQNEPPSPKPPPESPGVQQRRIQEAQRFAEAEQARLKKEEDDAFAKQRLATEAQERQNREQLEREQREREEVQRKEREVKERERLELEKWKALAAQGLADIKLCCEGRRNEEVKATSEAEEKTRAAEAVDQVMGTLRDLIPLPVNLGLERAWRTKWLGEESGESQDLKSAPDLLLFEKKVLLDPSEPVEFPTASGAEAAMFSCVDGSNVQGAEGKNPPPSPPPAQLPSLPSPPLPPPLPLPPLCHHRHYHCHR
jgi:hypothetical protein